MLAPVWQTLPLISDINPKHTGCLRAAPFTSLSETRVPQSSTATNRGLSAGNRILSCELHTSLWIIPSLVLGFCTARMPGIRFLEPCWSCSPPWSLQGLPKGLCCSHAAKQPASGTDRSDPGLSSARKDTCSEASEARHTHRIHGV